VEIEVFPVDVDEDNREMEEEEGCSAVDVARWAVAVVLHCFSNTLLPVSCSIALVVLLTGRFSRIVFRTTRFKTLHIE